MANSKQAKFIVDVSAESKHTRKSSVRFFSYDSKTAEIVIQAEKDNELIPRGTISNVEIYFESVNSSYRPTESLKWNDQMTINDDDLFLYTLTDDLLNYQGLVAFEVYINYINNDKSDSSNRIIYEQRTSAIDRATGEIEIVYIKDMETAKKEVADKAAEVKESLAGYDSGLDIYADQKKTEMDNFTRNVQETSINEITKIQNELPKVKQVNVDETKKIKAEYPIVEQVATTEKEKIRAVLSTVDQTASEVSAYADRKISEYDAKFTQSNQKMNDLQQSQTALTTKLTETQQKITDADVFTKAESSVNVINQIAGNIVSIIPQSLKLDGIDAKAFRLDNGVLIEFSNQDYSDFLGGAVVKAETNINGKNAEIDFSFELIPIFEALFPYLTEGLTSDSQKLSALKTVIKAIKVPHTARAKTSSKFDWFNYSAGNWAGITFTNNSSDFVEKIYEVNDIASATFTRLFGTTGIFKCRLYASGVSDGSTPSWVETTGLKLIIEFESSANKIIDYTIAAYCRPLEQQINDLAQKVAAMENK